MAAGPTSTTKIAGKMNSTSGKISCTAVLAAFSSASCRRRVRIESDWTRRAWAMLRAEAVGLDQDRRQAAHVVDAGADAQVVQHFAPRPAHLQLEVGQRQFLADGLGVLLHLVGHLPQGGVQPEARLHADDQQVEGVGQGQEDLLLPGGPQMPQDDLRQVEADPAEEHRPLHRLHREAVLEQEEEQAPGSSEHDQADHADALVDRRRPSRCGSRRWPACICSVFCLQLGLRLHHPAEVRERVLQPARSGSCDSACGDFDLDQRLRPADPFQPFLGLAVAVRDHRQQPERPGHDRARTRRPASPLRRSRIAKQFHGCISQVPFSQEQSAVDRPPPRFMAVAIRVQRV